MRSDPPPSSMASQLDQDLWDVQRAMLAQQQQAQQPQQFQQGFPAGGLAPQPTGFPGQRLQPQPTGFPGQQQPQPTGFGMQQTGFQHHTIVIGEAGSACTNKHDYRRKVGVFAMQSRAQRFLEQTAVEERVVEIDFLEIEINEQLQ